MGTARDVAAAQGLKEDGYRLVVNNGKNGEVFSARHRLWGEWERVVFPAHLHLSLSLFSPSNLFLSCSVNGVA